MAVSNLGGKKWNDADLTGSIEAYLNRKRKSSFPHARLPTLSPPIGEVKWRNDLIEDVGWSCFESDSADVVVSTDGRGSEATAVDDKRSGDVPSLVSDALLEDKDKCNQPPVQALTNELCPALKVPCAESTEYARLDTDEAETENQTGLFESVLKVPDQCQAATLPIAARLTYCRQEDCELDSLPDETKEIIQTALGLEGL